MSPPAGPLHLWDCLHVKANVCMCKLKLARNVNKTVIQSVLAKDVWNMVMFSVMFVRLFVCQQDYRKTTGLIFMKRGGRGGKAIKFWSGSKSKGEYTNYFYVLCGDIN